MGQVRAVNHYHVMTFVSGIFDTTPLKIEDTERPTPETDDDTNEDPADIVQPVFDEVTKYLDHFPKTRSPFFWDTCSLHTFLVFCYYFRLSFAI